MTEPSLSIPRRWRIFWPETQVGSRPPRSIMASMGKGRAGVGLGIACLLFGLGAALFFRKSPSDSESARSSDPSEVVDRADSTKDSQASPAAPEGTGVLSGGITQIPPGNEASLADPLPETVSLSVSPPAHESTFPNAWTTTSPRRQEPTSAPARPWGGASPAPAPLRRPDRSRSTHKVVDGDTLAGLAKRYLGDESRAGEIYQLNQKLLPSPDLLPIGVVLTLPTRDEKPADRNTGANSSHESPLVPIRRHFARQQAGTKAAPGEASTQASAVVTQEQSAPAASIWRPSRIP
jgi:LysM repeat protein